MVQRGGKKKEGTAKRRAAAERKAPRGSSEEVGRCYDDELELGHSETFWDRGLRGGLELGHEEVDVRGWFGAP